MSSALRSPSQFGVRVKYLIGLGLVACGNDGPAGAQFDVSGASVIRVTNGLFTSIETVATPAQITDAAADAISVQYCVEGAQSIAGVLFKDMGRSLTVVDATTGARIALYRECQLVAGGPEGVPEDSPAYGANYYVRVWAADGKGVAVARLG